MHNLIELNQEETQIISGGFGWNNFGTMVGATLATLHVGLMIKFQQNNPFNSGEIIAYTTFLTALYGLAGRVTFGYYFGCNKNCQKNSGQLSAANNTTTTAT